MVRFALRRLIIIPVVLLLVHLAGFAYAHLAGPLRAARIPYVLIQLDPPPLWPTYRNYMQNAARLDLGQMPGSSESLATAMSRAAANSLGLLALALVLSVLIGLSLGLRAARSDPPRVSSWLTLASTLGLAMPGFYIGSLFIVASVSYLRLQGSNAQAPFPLQGFGWDKHLVFPTLALMVRPTMQIARVTSSLLADELGKQYTLAARSFGHTQRAIRWRLALRNILAPVTLTIAGSLRLLVGELILIEWLFKWPGLGRLLAWTLVPTRLTSDAGSPLFLNPSVVAAVLTIIAALFLSTDFIAALLARLLDPRLRAPEEKAAYA
jgi:peptide/nickel transport system permease protein